MSDKSGNSGLAFIVGALVVAVLGLGYFVLGGGGGDEAEIKIDLDGN